jgi:hypothetical protein
MVIVSASVVELAVTVIVIVVAVTIAGELACSWGVAPVTATSGAEATLNSNPVGIVRKKTPSSISPEAPSTMIMGPNSVQAPPAVSADMAPPPAAGVTLAARTGDAIIKLKLKTSNRANIILKILILILLARSIIKAII